MALTFDDSQAAELLNTLGLPTDTTDTFIALATVKDAITSTGAGTLQPSAIAAAAKAAGFEVLDTDTATALRAEAAEGRQIKAAVARKNIEDTVANAINKGKVTVARREHWINLLTADPGMADVLNAVPDETAVPLNEIGHGIDNESGRHVPDDQWQW
jgi:hypothetical protein